MWLPVGRSGKFWKIWPLERQGSTITLLERCRGLEPAATPTMDGLRETAWRPLTFCHSSFSEYNPLNPEGKYQAAGRCAFRGDSLDCNVFTERCFQLMHGEGSTAGLSAESAKYRQNERGMDK